MTRKLLFGFALLVCAALVDVVVDSNPTIYADDTAKPATDDGKKTDDTAKPDQAKSADNAPKAQGENQSKKNIAEPLALPTDEAPLYPDYPIFVWCDDDGFMNAIVNTIANGYRKYYSVYRYDKEEPVRFELRTDGWTHASVKFFAGRQLSETSIDGYAVVLVPNEESLASWNAWYTKAVEEAREQAGWSEKRVYPSNVLPPK